MEKSSTNLTSAPGAEITLEVVEQRLKYDLENAMGCIHSIHSDPDLMKMVARFIYGRYQNAKQADALKSDT